MMFVYDTVWLDASLLDCSATKGCHFLGIHGKRFTLTRHIPTRWDQCDSDESARIAAAYQSLEPANPRTFRIKELINVVLLAARAMFIPRTEEATSTLHGAPGKRRGWCKFLEARSIDLLPGGILPAAPRITEQVRWVVAKMCLHSNGDSIAFVVMRMRWKANMTTHEAVTQHGDGLGGELLIRCK